MMSRIENLLEKKEELTIEEYKELNELQKRIIKKVGLAGFVLETPGNSRTAICFIVDSSEVHAKAKTTGYIKKDYEFPHDVMSVILEELTNSTSWAPDESIFKNLQYILGDVPETPRGYTLEDCFPNG